MGRELEVERFRVRCVWCLDLRGIASLGHFQVCGVHFLIIIFLRYRSYLPLTTLILTPIVTPNSYFLNPNTTLPLGDIYQWNEGELTSIVSGAHTGAVFALHRSAEGIASGGKD